MTDDEREKIRAEAFKEASLEERLKALEEGFSDILGGVKWFVRAVWGGVAYILTQIAQWLFSGGWPK
jgi:hypothetical protein